MSACTGKEPEPETPEETPEPEEPAQKPAGLNPAILLAVLALMGGGGAFAYFKLVKSRPKTKGNDNLDDMTTARMIPIRRTRTPGRPRI